MKNLTLVLVFFLASFATFATPDSALRRSNGLLKFIAEQSELRDVAFHSVIGARCSRYMSRDDERPCKDAVKKMLKTLDYDILFADEKIKYRQGKNWTPSSFVFVAFKKNLISLLNTPKTATYLRDLNQQLFQYLVGEKSSPNVWDITKGYYETDYMTSLVMASLFQDTSIMKLHLAWLERAGITGSGSFETNKELLGRVIDSINLILDSSESYYRALFYPPDIQRDLNRNIYHFYVPLFLSKSLQREGIREDLAFSAAIMLTLSYEFMTSSRDYRYVYKDPEKITLVSKIKDIFGGYCGANIGVSRTNFNKSLETIRSAFERSTEDGVSLLLRR